LCARQRTVVQRFNPRQVFIAIELFHFCLLPDASVSKRRLSCADQAYACRYTMTGAPGS
jgi:hypothetical protein